MIVNEAKRDLEGLRSIFAYCDAEENPGLQSQAGSGRKLNSGAAKSQMSAMRTNDIGV
ncbi:hypothetical protein [Mesorhizobium sp. M1A.F.Ca.ET.072.01.1.1]|uniref:hypothetical protein n=1 Tax=Mesorhizobium sp. M1A.F.Ca.ET.072.01.1.1 TaxID=2496753 RepID=UPI00167226E5|nr:hypothetical protein [Mesorhizobium sp. M1A.F.Ca.ET.072.01.1.1]